MHQNGMGMGRGREYKNYSRSGPLMTDHLQVRSLDRELEILRHKREVVQREQEMLTMECEMDRKRQYEHTNRNVSYAYGNVWQPPPPKRANTLQQPSPWMGTTRDNFGPNVSKSMPTNYIPSLLSKKFDPPVISAPMKPVVHPMLKNTVAPRHTRPNNVRKDFRSTNVFKKKLKNPPHKLNTYPLKDRKDLVLKSTESQLVKNKTNKSPEVLEDMILRDNQIPNNQVTGRLELALGSIVKEIRCSNSQNDKFLKLISNPKQQRTMKQAVRERIRTVMLNKTVGSVVDIVNQYREQFPKASDQDIVELVINSEQPNLVTVIETENPEDFFKKNIASILEKKIQEMASKLLKIYTSNRRKVHMKSEEDTNKKPDENESILNENSAMKILRGLTGKYVTVEEKTVLTKYYTQLIENILEEKIPQYLPKCTDQFLKIFDLDHRFKAVQSMATERVRDEVEGNKSQDKDLKNQDEINAEPSNKEENETRDNNQTLGETVSQNLPNTEMPINMNEAKESAKITLIAIDIEEPSIQEQEPQNIKSPAPLAKDPEPHEAIKPTTLLDKKTESPETVTPTTPLAKVSSSNTVNTPPSVSTPLSKELPYYVKLIGRPKLPNRAVICDFLNKYSPNSIKKHKSINNLLVVGFNNQEDYNKILTANETVIDDITIIIKASEKVTPGKENESKNEQSDAKKDTQAIQNVQKEKEIEDKVEQEAKDENGISKNSSNNSNAENPEEEKELIGKELDDQISDLLTTNKQAAGDGDKDNGKETPSLEPIKEGGDEIKNSAKCEPEKVDKVSKANVKESGRATPVRSSSRLGTVTPSTIRTRRASRLMQE